MLGRIKERGDNMVLFSAISDWRKSRHEKFISQMKEENKCPDCYGRGFLLYPANEFLYLNNPLDCPGCNGTGLYTDWVNTI